MRLYIHVLFDIVQHMFYSFSKFNPVYWDCTVYCNVLMVVHLSSYINISLEKICIRIYIKCCCAVVGFTFQKLLDSKADVSVKVKKLHLKTDQIHCRFMHIDFELRIKGCVVFKEKSPLVILKSFYDTNRRVVFVGTSLLPQFKNAPKNVEQIQKYISAWFTSYANEQFSY